ncbi:hydroxyacylglutathione hydrolase [Chthonobacter albigriseus]|uniref:hydroxyacylglutathione hydrolase n=1 Tax=Chthonobacter albigriseus TaxID=1683161 RepID=UPI0015EF93B3|nr:hydroxyacylglutathione hydrolase [Chthonobacter albigriseus]
MASPEIELVPCRSDNYAVLLHDPESHATVLVDAPDSAAIADVLNRRGWRLTDILITHHHHDHVAGLADLKAVSGARAIGPAAEADRIPGLDVTVSGGDSLQVGPYRVEVIATPGHTLGHVAYHLPDQALVFSGDTLFALGCGRLFEGTPEAMWQSLSTLAGLADETAVYCGHEYTLSNARFALTIEPGNAALIKRAEAIAAAREAGRPTIPTTIGLERATNPFLRAGQPAVKAAAGLPNGSDADVFAALRRMKDRA